MQFRRRLFVAFDTKRCKSCHIKPVVISPIRRADLQSRLFAAGAALISRNQAIDRGPSPAEKNIHGPGRTGVGGLAVPGLQGIP